MSRTLKKLVAGEASLVFILRDEQNYIKDKFRLRLRLLFQGFWGAISLEIEKFGLSEQIRTDIFINPQIVVEFLAFNID